MTFSSLILKLSSLIESWCEKLITVGVCARLGMAWERNNVIIFLCFFFPSKTFLDVQQTFDAAFFMLYNFKISMSSLRLIANELLQVPHQIPS